MTPPDTTYLPNGAFPTKKEYVPYARTITINGITYDLSQNRTWIVPIGPITLTGDVTGVGTGSVATTIANNVVTYAKMQQVSGGSLLLGRGSSGAGNVQEITLGTNLSMSGTTLNATGGGSVNWGGIGGTLSAQTDLQSALDGKVDENSPITGATKTKITYDSKGLVTSGADATTADIADSTNKRYVTDAQLVVIGNTSGTNSGNETAATIGTLINGSTAATPNDTDLVATAETSLLKKITWANVKAFLKTYFDTLYTNNAGTVTSVSVTTANGVSGSVATATTTPAITLSLGAITPTSVAASGAVTGSNLSGTNTGNETATTIGTLINAAGAATPNNSDLVATAEAAGGLKKITWTNVKAFLKTYFDTLYPSGSGTSSGTNTGDQTSIVGITGTKSQFDTACTDGNFLFSGDVTQYTDEMAQDAVGAMVDTTLTYVDGTPSLGRAALTGAITASAGSNTTALGSFTKSQLDGAVSDGNVVYTGDGIDAGANTIKTTGQIGVGVTPAANFQVEISSDVNTATALDLSMHTADLNGPVALFKKSRGTHASPTATQSGDRLGFLGFAGLTTGTTYFNSVALIVTAEENFASGQYGAGIQIETSNTGGGSPGRVARARFHASGNVSIGTSLIDNGFRLDVTGNSRVQGSSTSTGNALIVSDSAADPIITLTNTGAAQFRAVASPATPSAGDGTIFIDSTAKALFIKNDAGVYKGKITNAAIASQGAGFATDTYVTNSDLIIPSFNLQAKSTFLWRISASKTGAGTATPIYNIRIGSGRSTSDTARLTLTGPAQTAVADIGTLWIMVTVRSVGAGASDTVIEGAAWWNHQGTAANTTTQGVGFANNGTGHVQGTSAGFSNTGLPGLYIGLSINGGTSAAWTITQVQGELTY